MTTKLAGSGTTSTQDLLEAAEELRGAFISRATTSSSGISAAEFRKSRLLLVNEPSIQRLIPKSVKNCRNEADFWSFIRTLETYRERREFLREDFEPLLGFLERGTIAPLNEDALHPKTWESVQEIWKKALLRKDSDPGGAITAARTLLEEVCKHILDEANVAYDEKADLPPLYGLAAKRMNIAPSQHTEEIFKQILGGCHSVVQGLGALRSRIGDAHGQGKVRRAKPAPRHAELAVNLAGAMASYLIQTWQAQEVGLEK